MAIDDRQNSPTDVIRAMVSMFRTGDCAQVGDFVDTDYVDHQDPVNGPEGFERLVIGARSPYVKLDVVVADVIESEDRVAVRLRWHGTLPSGKVEERETIDIVRVADGRAIEHWGGRSNV